MRLLRQFSEPSGGLEAARLSSSAAGSLGVRRIAQDFDR
jgi:hypothetical protein